MSLFAPKDRKWRERWMPYERAEHELHRRGYGMLRSSRRTAKRYLRRVVQEEGYEKLRFLRPQMKAKRGKGRFQWWIRRADVAQVVKRRRQEVLAKVRASAACGRCGGWGRLRARGLDAEELIG